MIYVKETFPTRIAAFYSPVDLLLVFETPDDIPRTKHMGVYQTFNDAVEASETTVWIKSGECWLSQDGKWRIQSVST